MTTSSAAGAPATAANPTVAVFLMLLLTVAMEAGGQLLYKSGINQVGAVKGSLTNLSPFLQFLLDAVSNWRVLAGILVYCLQALFWWSILSRVDLSYAFPLTSLSYVIVLLTARAFLGEHVSVERWLGAITVVFGVYLITRSG